MTFRKRWLALVATLTLLAPADCTTPGKQEWTGSVVAAQRGPIRVGARNVEWLGSPERRSGPARDQARTAADLAEYILAGDVDILGLEEIKIDTEDGSNTNTLLSVALGIVEGKRGGHWQHRIFPTHRGRDLCCGIAWDSTRVTPIDEPRIVTDPNTRSSQGSMLWVRPPRGLRFSAGEGLTDFVVVVIHMKADYRGKFAQHRAEEAQHLVSDLPEVFGDPDVMIIGDANCAHAEPAVATITAVGFVDLNAHDLETHWRYGALDRAFVPREQPEFARQCFEVLSDSFFSTHHVTRELFKLKYSDHFMVITEVDVMKDDD